MDPRQQGGVPSQPYHGGAYSGPPPPGQYGQGVPPPQGNYGGQPPPGHYNQYGQGAPPPQGNYGGPPPPGQYGPGAPPPQGGYGGPPPQGNYGGPPPPGQFGPGVPPPQGGYGAVNPAIPMGEKMDPNMTPGGQAAPAPSAPSLNQMDNVAGYENIGFSDSFLPPPSYEEATRPPEREEIKNIGVVNEEQARDALLAYVAENCCFGKGAAQDMKFTELKPTNAFHYTLESFCESRATSWAFEPYVGQILDTPANGRSPAPWDITPSPGPTMFKNSQSNLEVPHTASVKPCHNCCASGWIQCTKCFGMGHSRCNHCHGMGHSRTHMHGEWENRRCTWCHGRGMRTCHDCQGCGRVTCSLCAGRTQVKCYIRLTVNWVNHMNDHIVERTALPTDLIRNVSGQEAFNETAPRVFPVNHFPDPEINNASQSMVTSHNGSFPTERILMQRQIVRIVPVTQALYKWKGDNSDFFVYGFENKVYAPKYPQTCCCGCTIL